MDEIFIVRVQGFEQRGGETAGRTQARAGRNIGHGGQFKPVAIHAQQGKRFTEDRVLQLRRVRHPLQFGIFDDEVGHERFMHRDVNIFVNRRGDEEAAEFFVIRRQIRPAAAEGDSQR